MIETVYNAGDEIALLPALKYFEIIPKSSSEMMETIFQYIWLTKMPQEMLKIFRHTWFTLHHWKRNTTTKIRNSDGVCYSVGTCAVEHSAVIQLRKSYLHVYSVKNQYFSFASCGLEYINLCYVDRWREWFLPSDWGNISKPRWLVFFYISVSLAFAYYTVKVEVFSFQNFFK